MKKFNGTGVALVTPFKKDGEVDYSALEKLVEFQIQNGVNYLVVQGTTGESVTLTDQEKISVLEFVIEINKERLPIVLGIGGNNTNLVIEQINQFSNYKIDGILSVSPYYNKPSQEGIYAHYKALSKASSLPIILYNVPGRTSSNINPDTTLKLANECENIVAIKEASAPTSSVKSFLFWRLFKFKFLIFFFKNFLLKFFF
mgnify:CR=1 FL=1